MVNPLLAFFQGAELLEFGLHDTVRLNLVGSMIFNYIYIYTFINRHACPKQTDQFPYIYIYTHHTHLSKHLNDASYIFIYGWLFPSIPGHFSRTWTRPWLCCAVPAAWPSGLWPGPWATSIIPRRRRWWRRWCQAPVMLGWNQMEAKYNIVQPTWDITLIQGGIVVA